MYPRQSARLRLESKLKRISRVRAAKQTIPFALAHLDKWLLLIDGRGEFQSRLPSATELDQLVLPGIPLHEAYPLVTLIRSEFKPAWRRLVATTLTQQQSEQAWKLCFSRLLACLYAAVSGHTQTMAAHVRAAEECLQ